VGTLAEHFLEHGFTVTGVDLSEPILAIARQRLRAYPHGSQARLIQADATSFSVDDRFVLATSTFDALNMLQSSAALSSCFASVRRALATDGMFFFDLVTPERFLAGPQLPGSPRHLQERVRRRGEGDRATNGLHPGPRSLGQVRRVPHAEQFDRVFFMATRACRVDLRS
jgi:SAM-dependent methyltransferase